MEQQQQKNSSSSGGDLLSGQISSASNDGGCGDSINTRNSSMATTKTALSNNPITTDSSGEKGVREDGGPEGQHSSGTQDDDGAQPSTVASSGEKVKRLVG